MSCFRRCISSPVRVWSAPIVLLLVSLTPASGALAQSAFPALPSAEFAEGRVLVRLRPADLTDRVQAGDFTGSLAGGLAVRLGGAASEPLFPEVHPGVTTLAREVSLLEGALPPESANVRRERRRRLGLDRWIMLELAGGESVEQALERLAGDALVEIVEPDYRGRATGYTPDDTRFGEQWYLEQASDADIDVTDAWDIARSASDVPIAVLDSGVQLGHPDLEEAILPGWDYVNGDSDPSDDNGHGTHVAGLIAAAGDNGRGIAGVAFHTRVVPLKVLDAALWGYYSDWIKAFYYSADLGVRVANLSAGGIANSAALHSSIQYAHERGVVVCAAMMNFGTDVPYYPAAYEETIAVGATDRFDRRADPFTIVGEDLASSYGPHIDLVAPGDGLLSTYANGDYARGWGTSQSTPLVSGTAALMISVDSGLEPEEVRSILRATADDTVGRATEDTPGFDIYHGAGRLNTGSAVTEVASGITLPTSFTVPPPRPNPSSGPVRFLIDLPQSARVTVRIYDSRGRLVRTLLDGVLKPAGSQTVTWSGTNSAGRTVPSGVYVYEIIAGGRRTTGKLTRLK